MNKLTKRAEALYDTMRARASRENEEITLVSGDFWETELNITRVHDQMHRDAQDMKFNFNHGYITEKEARREMLTLTIMKRSLGQWKAN